MNDISAAVYAYGRRNQRRSVRIFLSMHLSFRMLLTRAVRPDRLIVAAKAFVASVFGQDFVEKAHALLNLGDIVDQEVSRF